jgi:Gluconate 2-dehydrogenase subunit 3
MSQKQIPGRPDFPSRRELLRTAGAGLGAALLPTSQTQEKRRNPGSQPMAAKNSSRPARFFTPGEYVLVEELAETIIPADSRSGGAKAAKVANYIEQVVGESLGTEQKTLWREGLQLIDAMSSRHCGKPFVAAGPEDRVAVLRVLSENRETTLPELRFFGELKRLTVDGYYTSKIGLLDELGYKGNTVLDEFVGCEGPGR